MMLKKIIAIRNVGRFNNSATQGNPQLAKHTLIVGANGYGKTTICAILRSLQTGEPAYIIGRKTLGIVETASVELLFDTGVVRFDGTAWGAAHPNFAIFDGTFITENVYSGEVVEMTISATFIVLSLGRKEFISPRKTPDLRRKADPRPVRLLLLRKSYRPIFQQG